MNEKFKPESESIPQESEARQLSHEEGEAMLTDMGPYIAGLEENLREKQTERSALQSEGADLAEIRDIEAAIAELKAEIVEMRTFVADSREYLETDKK